MKFDVVVIGGGATGAGVFLELARRGIRVALFEKGDFSSGTTSKSSRLIHGGIRYLEHFHFDLVYESLKEREWIGLHFGHLVNPLDIHIPIYSHSRRHPAIVAIGVLLYDFMAGKRRIGRSRVYMKAASIPRELEMTRKELRGLFTFTDYQILLPERLVLANILEGMNLGGEAFNYARVESLKFEENEVRLEIVRGGEKFEVRAEVVVNAAGPWADEVRRKGMLGGRLLRPTKGVHLEVERVSEEAFFVESGRDRRLFFVLPFLGHTLVGTTDTDFDGSPDEVEVLGEDVDYLLQGLRIIFPDKLARGVRIFGGFAGVRPLLRVPGKPASAVPRRHRIVVEGRGERLVSIVGGKLTTYRRMAEDCVSKILSIHGSRLKTERAQPYPFEGDGGDTEAYLSHIEGEFGVTPAVACALFRAYGRKAHHVLSFAGSDRDLREVVFEETGEIPLQIVYGFEREMCRSLEDVVLRRMMLGKTPTKGMNELEMLKKILISHLGKSPGESRDMVKAYACFVEDNFRVTSLQSSVK